MTRPTLQPALSCSSLGIPARVRYECSNMRRSCSLLAMTMALAVGGCGDDAVGGAADGTGTGTTGETSSGEPPGLDSTGSAEEDTSTAECARDEDCDDADPCSADVCQAGVCTVEGTVLSNECRPAIDVEFPPRAATLESSSPVVTVTGSVASEEGAIVWLRINGEDVPVEADGRFSHDVIARTGGNTLVLETADDQGVERRRVQSFLWSTGYHAPTEAPGAGMLSDGLAIYLAQESLDDGDHTQPIDDIATLLGLAMGAIDLGSFIDPTTPVANAIGYDVYVSNLTSTSSDVALEAIDGGIRMTATIYGMEGDLFFDGTFDNNGGFAIASVQAVTDLLIDVNAEHQLAIAVIDPQTTISELDLWADGALGALIYVFQGPITDSMASDLEASLTDQLTGLMGPAVGLALGAMAPNTTLSFPRIGGDEPIPVRLRTDFHEVEFEDGQTPPDPPPPQGGDLVERGGAYALEPVTPHENLGVPDWDGCGLGAPEIPLLRESPLEIALTDDLLNQLLYGAWRGGMLEFEMPPELLPADTAIISDLQVKVSGMLAPTASDCGPDGRLRLHIGDIRIDGSLVLGELPITFVAYSSLEAGLDVVPTKTGIGITLAEVERIDTELTVMEAGGIEAEPTLRAVLESQLVEGVLGSLGGGLGGIELPQLDLSATLGLPPGSAMIQIMAEEAQRMPGTTLVLGHL
jgi:hypothetical protein